VWHGPFTLAHFRHWASDLILDTGESWHPEDFQEEFVTDLFSGVPEIWFVVPEANGKTTLLAGLALYHCEFRPFAAVPIAASSREQAEIMYRQAEGFVLRSPRLYAPAHSAIAAAKGKRKTEVPTFLPLEGHRRINHHAGGRIQVFAADDRTGDGVIPTLGLLDELHRHRTLALYRTWVGKIAKRGGQVAAISTGGEAGSEFEATRERIRQMATETTRRGSFLRAVSPQIVLHEWAVPEKGDVTDFRLVKSANPFSRITEDTLRQKFHSPTMTHEHWSRFVCNLASRSERAAVGEAEWAAAEVDDEIPPGVPIDVGLDVAWKHDTTSAVPLWWRDEEYRLLGPASILVPPRDGTSLDPHKVENALIAIHERNPIQTLVMDMSRAEQLASWAEEEFGCTVIDRGQSNVAAVQDYERFMDALRQGWLKHTGDKGLGSHVLNAIARVTPYGDARFDRPAEGRLSKDQDRRVIDALVAAAMVHYVASVSAEEPVWTAA
jgi:phage terminase large subunit-like protein